MSELCGELWLETGSPFLSTGDDMTQAAELDVWKPDQITDLTARLMKFYQVTNINDLIKAQCDHVERLQAKIPKRDIPICQKVRFA